MHLQVVKPAHEGIVREGDVLEGRYRLQHVIGDGGMGTVFAAEHVLIKRRVAIKILHRDLVHDPEVVERFMDEARAAGTLGHPNIVESTDMGFARNEVPFIVFEYLEGSALSDEIYRLGGLTVRRALKIAHQIASALEAAHGAGIIHRDLKSDNIFLTDRDGAADHVKVLDFGISRFLVAENDRTGRGGKRANVMMGTPEFMAPEQITAPDRVDARTDIYALGVVLYEMLAGRTPFVNENPADPTPLLHSILLDRPPAFAREDLPAGLADMIFEKLLAKEPAARYASMRDVQGALDAFIGVMKRDTPLPGALPAITLPVSLPAPEPRKRRSWPWLALALVAGGAGAALLLTATPTTTQPMPDTSALERDAQQIANAFDAAAASAQARADGISTSPILRAAIETDAATLADMARDGALLAPQAGEALEIFQLRDNRDVSLLRMPAGSPPLPASVGKGPHISLEGPHVRVVAGTAVTRTTGGVGGSVTFAVPVDVRASVPQIGAHALTVSLVGDGLALPLAQAPGAGVARSFPVHSKVGDLALVATVHKPFVTLPPDLVPAYACFGAGGLFLLLFAGSALGRRR